MVLLLMHFRTGDESVPYWLEPRLVERSRFDKTKLTKAIDLISKKYEALDYDIFADRVMSLLYGVSGWSYFYGLSGATICQIEEVFV